MIAFFLALHYWIRGLDSNSVDWIEPCYSSEKKRKERRDEAKLWLQRYAKRLKLGMITIWIPGCNIFIWALAHSAMIAFFLALHYWIRGLDSNSVDWIEPCYSSEKKRKERRDEAKLWLQRYAQRLKLRMYKFPEVMFSFIASFFLFLWLNTTMLFFRKEEKRAPKQS